MNEISLEVWQRGPIKNFPVLLQPIVHALLQADEEVISIMKNFPEELLWQKPAGVASPAFHLQHITGVLDRLFTYARKEPLNATQLAALREEGNNTSIKTSSADLIALFEKQVKTSLKELAEVKIETLTDVRTIGRKQIPTTLIGLYVHAAEHTMRHVGQLLVTVKILKK